jgi:Nucleotide modification associated domain 2
MLVWTYVITHDCGGAPNFEPPATTLTLCAPRVRRQAVPGWQSRTCFQ